MKPSGVAWMGDIPSTWETKRIKDMNPHYLSGVWGDYAQCSSSGVIVLRSTEQNVNGDLNIKEPAILDIPVIRKNNVLQAKDLLLTKSSGSLSHVGKCSYITESSGAGACFSNFMMGMRFKDNVFTRFLYFVLNTPFIKEQMRNTSLSITLNNLTNSTVNSLYVLLPSLSEQTAIASFLDDRTTAIDSKIQLLEEKATALADLRKSVIHQAVTKGLDPNVAMKPSGVDWIGDVPGHWDVIKAKSVFAASNSGEVIDKSYWAPGSQTLYTCAKNAMPCTYDTFPSWKRTTGRDLLLTRNATPYIHKPRAGSIYSNVVQRVNLRETVHRDFLGYALQMSADLSLLSEGSTIASLNYSTWCALIFALPPLQQQIEIANQLNSATDVIDESIKTITAQLEALKSLRQSIIHEAVTGKIDVADHGYHYA